MSTLHGELEEEAKQKWQKEWEEGTKAAITKEIFPKVQDRLKLKIDINPIFTIMVTGHGITRAYLHRFKILEHATCLCGKGDQTIDHLINQCSILHKQRDLFRSRMLKTGNWPAYKHEIITKHLQSFLVFIKSVNFDQL
jgi:hypothetical protein